MKCLNCGECCKYMTIRFVASDYKDSDINDFRNYLDAHSCMTRLDEGIITILVPNICKNLDVDEKGKCICLINDNKPDICKKFWCKKSGI